MLIHGINKLTLLDYPGHTACTLFTGSCNFRCPFCQNGGLVQDPAGEPVLDPDWLMDFLKKRRHLLQGVCISGGEPTLQEGLIPFVRELRRLGYKVKLDTNGYRPEVLKALLAEELLSAVAMDIKSSIEHYSEAAGLSSSAFDPEKIKESVGLLRGFEDSHPDFYLEFRTTMVRGLQTGEDMISIGSWLGGASHYYLQGFEDGEEVIRKGLSAFSFDEMKEMEKALREYIPSVSLRGL